VALAWLGDGQILVHRRRLDTTHTKSPTTHTLGLVSAKLRKDFLQSGSSGWTHWHATQTHTSVFGIAAKVGPGWVTPLAGKSNNQSRFPADPGELAFFKTSIALVLLPLLYHCLSRFERGDCLFFCCNIRSVSSKVTGGGLPTMFAVIPRLVGRFFLHIYKTLLNRLVQSIG
jgi:hypothetical protein